MYVNRYRFLQPLQVTGSLKFNNLFHTTDEVINLKKYMIKVYDQGDLGFLNSGRIMDDFKVEGKVPVVIERFTIERIVGDISLEIYYSTVVGTGLRSQYESDD